MEIVFYEAEDDIAMVNDSSVNDGSLQSHSDEEKDERTAAVPREKDIPSLVQVYSVLYTFV